MARKDHIEKLSTILNNSEKFSKGPTEKDATDQFELKLATILKKI